MPRYRFRVQLTLAAPIISQLTGGRAAGMDTAATRAADGRPALPGSLIRGNIRHAWTAFAELAGTVGLPDVITDEQIEDWLGLESHEETDNDPHRARLGFDDFWIAESPEEPLIPRYRIAIEAQTGAVASGALQVIENVYHSGDEVVFVGHVHAHCKSADEAAAIKRWLGKALQYQPALGALKGVGYGRITKVEVGEPEYTGLNIAIGPVADTMLGLSIKPDRPFCFARPHAVNNRFESEDFIPGGAIKGALASQVMNDAGKQAWPTLHAHFDSLCVSHAHPAPENQTGRSVIPPLSLVHVKDDQNVDVLYDVALCDAGLIHGQAPTFSVDWKGEAFGLAEALCGYSVPERELRVRTAIDPGSGTAREEHLFAMDTVRPDGHHWLANISLDGIPEDQHQTLAEELRQVLSHGLSPLGKTKARAIDLKLRQEAYAPFLDSFGVLHDDYAIITLQSAARLLPQPWTIKSTNDGETLKNRYADAWSELSGNSLELVRFYAQQMLVGGKYLWTRFAGRQVPYNPELLTLAGSVFVLRAQDHEKAKACIERWLSQGLPQLKDAPGGEDWRKTPYLAANGYGEIAVNLKLHWNKKPPEENWDGLD